MTRTDLLAKIEEALAAAELLRQTESSRELSLVITKLEEAKLWLGARFAKPEDL